MTGLQYFMLCSGGLELLFDKRKDIEADVPAHADGKVSSMPRDTTAADPHWNRQRAALISLPARQI